mmetsp:Transcript_9977/g.25245  ORF Transcript_9977/g.25245 Transcript_9977/m.25245 type:complete len:266 (-) Transcript_9977:824-1621(-)
MKSSTRKVSPSWRRFSPARDWHCTAKSTRPRSPRSSWRASAESRFKRHREKGPMSAKWRATCGAMAAHSAVACGMDFCSAEDKILARNSTAVASSSSWPGRLVSTCTANRPTCVRDSHHSSRTRGFNPTKAARATTSALSWLPSGASFSSRSADLPSRGRCTAMARTKWRKTLAAAARTVGLCCPTPRSAASRRSCESPVPGSRTLSNPSPLVGSTSSSNNAIMVSRNVLGHSRRLDSSWIARDDALASCGQNAANTAAARARVL